MNAATKRRHRAPSTAERTATVAEAISFGIGDLLALGEECREVCENMPDSLQQSQRYETLDTTANELESLEEPEVPASVAEQTVSWRELTGRRGFSRSARRDSAVAALQAALDLVVEVLERGENSELEQLEDELQSFVTSAEACDFPGMYG